MPRSDVLPPANWEDFEDLCLVLWRLLWKDDHARKHGRQGQGQAGVDVYGKPNGGPTWAGVQCKQKTQFLGKKLTAKEIEEEVKKARTFEPALAHFTLATTAPRDKDIEAEIRRMSDEEQAGGSFRVHVAFWEDILEDFERLEEANPGILDRHLRRWRRRPSSVAGAASVPNLPPHYLERSSYLEPLKQEVLREGTHKLGLTGAGVVGVQGMGGIGKTVLAAALAWDEDVRRAFADGIFWVTVGQSPDLAALQGDLAAAAGHPEPVFGSVHQGKRELQELLAGRKALLVADDVWTAQAAAAFDVVGTPGRLVITTRHRDVIVGLGAQEHRLDVLEREQALAFLADWAGHNVDDLPEEAARVAQECGYLPLALAMVGAMVRHRPTGWSDALTRLERADLDKIGRDYPDYPYPDLLRALEVSVDALSSEDRDRYLELAVFQEDEEVPEAALATLWSAAGLEGLDTRDLIHRLADRSLGSVTKAGGLRLHDLQRDYVRKQAAETLVNLHQRLLEAYRRRCTDGWANGPNDGYYFRRLPYHLTEAGRSDELRSLLMDFRWLWAKLHAAGIVELISDFDQLPESDGLRQIQGALRIASHVLVNDPQQLSGQLLGRLRADPDVPELDELLHGCRAGPANLGPSSTPAVFLLPRLASLTPPGGPLVRTLEGHRGPVYEVATLPNGRVVSASDDGTLRVWDPERGTQLRSFEGRRGALRSLTVLSDGRLVFALSEEALVWDPETGAAVTLKGHRDEIWALTAVAGGIVVSASKDGTLRAWNPASGTALASFQGHGEPIRALAPLATGHVVSACNDGTLRVWDPASGTALATLKGHKKLVFAVTVLPDGRVVSASGDKTIRVWDPANGAELATLEGHARDVVALAVLAADRIVSGSEDGTLRVWNPNTGTALATLEGHEGPVRVVAQLADRRVVSASPDNTLRVWDPARGVALATLISEEILAVTILGEGRIVSASRDSTLRVWDLGRLAALPTHEPHRRMVRVLTPLADGRFVSASPGGTIRVWDPEHGATIKELKGKGGITTLAALGDSRLVSGSWRGGGGLQVWDPTSGDLLATLDHRKSKVGVMAAAPLANGCVVAAYDDASLRVWDPTSGEVLVTFEGRHEAFRGQFVSAPEHGRVVALYFDGSVNKLLMWEPTGGAVPTTLDPRIWAIVTLLAVLADGRIVLTHQPDDTLLRVLDPAIGAPLATFEGHHKDVTAVTELSGGRIVSASFDRTLRVWDLASGAGLAILEGHTGPVQALAALDDGRVVSVGDDKTVRVWESTDGQSLSVFTLDTYPTSLAVTSTGVVTVGDQLGGVHVLDLVDTTGSLELHKREPPDESIGQ